jgi:hypothetical protein
VPNNKHDIPEWRRLTSGVVAGPLCLIALACGSSKGPEMAQVYGKVTSQGQPVMRGTMSFTPANGQGSPATGSISSDGSYTLQTIEPGDGARLGEYRVAITTRHEELPLPADKPVKKSARRKPQTPLIKSSVSNRQNSNNRLEKQGSGRLSRLVDDAGLKKYENPNTSGLTASVKSGKNPLDFDLK